MQVWFHDFSVSLAAHYNPLWHDRLQLKCKGWQLCQRWSQMFQGSTPFFKLSFTEPGGEFLFLSILGLGCTPMSGVYSQVWGVLVLPGVVYSHIWGVLPVLGCTPISRVSFQVWVYSQVWSVLVLPGLGCTPTSGVYSQVWGILPGLRCTPRSEVYSQV